MEPFHIHIASPPYSIYLTMTSDTSCSFPLYNNNLRPHWKIASDPVPYPEAKAHMESRVRAIYEGRTGEQIWLLEHPPLYTAGTSASAADLITPERFPVYDAGRGGQYTYHGPGQRVAYVMMNLTQRRKDIRCFVNQLEGWVIDTLACFDVRAERREGRIGVWVVKEDGSEAKIAAIGVRIRRWVSFHGISINLNPNLSHFSGIVPCGITEYGVTSLHDLGIIVSMAELDAALLKTYTQRFGTVLAG